MTNPSQPPVESPAPAPVADPAEHCANCGTALVGPCCHACGQRAELGAPVTWRWLYEQSFPALTDLEAPLWNTVRDMLVRPGAMLQGYLAGRRVDYTPPVKFAFLTAVVLTLVTLFAWVDKEHVFEGSSAGFASGAAFSTDSLFGTTPAERAAVEEWRGAPVLALEPASGYANRPAVAAVLQQRRTLAREADVNAAIAEFLEVYFDNLHWLTMLGLPVLALAMRLLWHGTRRKTSEHLVVVSYLTGTLTLLQLPAVLLPALGDALAIASVLVAETIALGYFTLALRALHGGGLVSTLVRVFALRMTLYGFILVVVSLSLFVYVLVALR